MGPTRSTLIPTTPLGNMLTPSFSHLVVCLFVFPCVPEHSLVFLMSSMCPWVFFSDPEHKNYFTKSHAITINGEKSGTVDHQYTHHHPQLCDSNNGLWAEGFWACLHSRSGKWNHLPLHWLPQIPRHWGQVGCWSNQSWFWEFGQQQPLPCVAPRCYIRLWRVIAVANDPFLSERYVILWFKCVSLTLSLLRLADIFTDMGSWLYKVTNGLDDEASSSWCRR